MTPMKAIRAKCLGCCCGASNEVRLCTAKKCPLYPYRFGKNPNRTRIGNHNAVFSFQNPNSTQDSEEKIFRGVYKYHPDTNGAESLVNPNFWKSQGDKNV